MNVLVCTNWNRISEKVFNPCKKWFAIIIIMCGLLNINVQAVQRAQSSISNGPAPDEAVEQNTRQNMERISDASSTDTISIDSREGIRDVGDTENLLSESMELKNVAEEQEDTVVALSKPLPYKMRKLLIHGSFYVVGACTLIAGGVASRFHPHVDPDEYTNCTTDNSSLT